MTDFHVNSSGFRNRALDINSPANPKFRLWKTLIGSRGIKRSGYALVSGAKIVPEMLRLRPGIAEGLICNARDDRHLADIPPDIPQYSLSGELFRELDVHGTAFPLLLVKTPEIPSHEPDGCSDGISLLVPFQDPGNVGAVIRSAAAFGVKSVVLLEEAALPFHPKSIRAGGTSIFLVTYTEGPSIHKLDAMDIPIVALAADGVPLDKFRFPGKFALLPGLEGPGMPENVPADFTVSIPMERDVESLNAAVAASIILFEYRQRMRSENRRGK
ncbi:RNA methyltransferase [bacterium]|nr:RNA methyltransferase [bacterium]